MKDFDVVSQFDDEDSGRRVRTIAPHPARGPLGMRVVPRGVQVQIGDEWVPLSCLSYKCPTCGEVHEL